MSVTTRGGRAIRIVALLGACLAGAYCLLGYVVLPVLIQKILLPDLSAQTGSRLEAGTLSFDPFAFVLRLGAISLKDGRGESLVNADAAVGDLHLLKSLRERRLNASLDVEGLSANLRIDADGRSNFDFLFQGESSQSAFALPFRLEEIRLKDAGLTLRAHIESASVNSHWSGVELTIRELSSDPGASGTFALEAKEDSDGKVIVEGQLGLEPLFSRGTLKVANFPLEQWAKPLLAAYRLDAKGGRANLSSGYRLEWKDGKVRLELEGAELELGDLALADSAGKAKLAARRLKARVGKLNWPAARLSIDSVLLEDLSIRDEAVASGGEPSRVIEAPSLSVQGVGIDLSGRYVEVETVDGRDGRLQFRRDSDGRWSWPGKNGLDELSRSSPTPSAPAASPWRLKIVEMRFSGYALAVHDELVQPAVSWEGSDIALKLSEVSSESGGGVRMSLNGRLGRHGQVEMEGKLALQPVVVADFYLSLNDFELAVIQPYVKSLSGITVERGRLNLAGNVDFYQGPTDSLRFSGRADIADLLTRDKREGKSFVRWKNLALNGLIFETIPKRLSIRDITAEEPYARVRVAADGAINIAENLGLAGDSKVVPATGEETAIVVGALRITEGRVDFSDESLQPMSFATQIRGLHGNIRGLSSQRSARADLLLEGRINDSSQLKISGQVNPFSLGTYTDVLMEFHDVNLTTLSPYAGKFAGYRIEKGKLSMNLRYKLDDGKLEGENELSFDHLVLGERVESRDATSLPVELAVALLKDRDGRIDVSLPVSGDLRDPQVSIRNLLAGAVTQFLGKLVGSPFSMLGTLFEADSEELGSVSFEPGQDLLSTDELSKLAKVSLALKERPGLLLDIQGMADEKADRSALAERGLIRQLKRMRRVERDLGDEPASDDRGNLSDADFARLFSQYCRDRSGGVPAGVGVLEPDGSLSGDRLVEVKRQVLAHWPVGELELRGLAMSRGERIRHYLVSEGGLPDQRIFLLDAKFTATDARKIKAMLSLSAP